MVPNSNYVFLKCFTTTTSIRNCRGRFCNPFRKLLGEKAFDPVKTTVIMIILKFLIEN